MALTATGVGSGLDIESLVTKLMDAERTPKEGRLLAREADLTNDISGLARLKGALSELQTSLATASAPATYQQRNATSNQSSKVDVSASSLASVGSYAVAVQSLASSQSLAIRDTFATVNETVGTGTLTFTFGTTGYTTHANDSTQDTYDSFVAQAGVSSKAVTIDSSSNTLSGVRDAINNADIGVTAAIVKTGSAYRLLVSSDASGLSNGMQITVSDSGDSNNTDGNGLSRLAFNASAGTANVYQTIPAADAAFTVNGLALSSASNTVANVIDGLTLTLKDVTTTTATLSVSDNTSGIKTAVNTFVDGYNSLVTTLDDLTGYDFATKTGGPLQGDFSVLSIASQLRTTLGAAAKGFTGSYSRLAELGITTSSTGQLAVDDTKLSAALVANYDDVTAVLTHFAEPSLGSGLTSVSATTSVGVGLYSVAVSSLAVSGSKTSSSLSAPITINTSNETFTLTIDGTSSGTITLSNGTYGSVSALATELQTQINADATLRLATKAATVSVDGSSLKITSNAVGAGSSVQLANGSGDTTLTTLGFNTAASSNGADLVGTINGVAGVAAGNILSGAVGSDAAGLAMAVTSTTGGTITVSQGVLGQLDNLLTGLLGDDKSLNTRITSLQSQAEDIVTERADLTKTLAATEARLRRQFNSLDSLVNQLTSTGSFVAAQLANIPIPGKTSK
ncbi:flagellar filament capping protein FliD [Luminiphilus sp.]|nr:flagellar filament capping protein FliD [Luminiphilus sp.]